MENKKEFDIKEIKFNQEGLIPVIIQEADSKEILMLAYMNEESLKITLEEKRTCFYSRSRKKLWKKGETSGNIQTVCEVFYDCDGDTLLVTVKQKGPACHTGKKSCFFRQIGKKSYE